MKLIALSSLVLGLSGLVGCSNTVGDAGGPSGGAASQDDLTSTETSAQIEFSGSSDSFDGDLYEGEAVSVSYDVNRLRSCTRSSGDPHHGPQFDFMVHYRWNADDSFASREIASSNGAWPITLTAPFGATDLELYVEATNPQGCTEYDSKDGANFHYPVAKSRLPVVHFEQDGSVTQVGTLAAGSPMLVDYASMHLENCNQSGRSLKMFGRTDGQDLPTQELAEASRYERTIGRLTPPSGARHLELWFETIDFHACTQWDSANGQNFQFDLQ